MIARLLPAVLVLLALLAPARGQDLSAVQQPEGPIQQVVLDMIGRFPADLDALGARAALEHTRGDGHATSLDDIRLFETGL